MGGNLARLLAFGRTRHAPGTFTAAEAAMDAGDELSTAAELRRLSPDIPDAVPLDLLDLARQENTRLIERLERLTGDLSALGERATAAREAMASVDSRLDHIERQLGIQKP